MSKYRGPMQKPQDEPSLEQPSELKHVPSVTTADTITPAPLGFLPNRPRRFLCFECLHLGAFLSREALKAHIDGGHR